MYYFCTYFDRHYLPRGISLFRSLKEHCPNFRLWVLCLDDESHELLTELDMPEIFPIVLKNFEADDEALLAAKQGRSKIEYYFTCTPSLPLYILRTWPEVDRITYLDADLFFFSSPEPLFEELKSGSIAIIEHRFPPKLRHNEIRGIYNVGWLSFRRDYWGLSCLNWWRDRCIEWCYDRTEDGRYADQKYLDDWTTRFQNVVVLEHKGANLALWNLANYQLNLANNDAVMVDEQPLIFFHFHGLKKLTGWLYNPGWSHYGVVPSRILREFIYEPYIQELFRVSNELLATQDIDAISYSVRGRPIEINERIKHLIRRIYRFPCVMRDILMGKYIIKMSSPALLSKLWGGIGHPFGQK